METVSSPRSHHSRAALKSPTQTLPSRRVTTPHNAISATVKTPSPNYFAFHASEDSSFPTDPSHHSKQQWSPPSSAVRSTAAASPTLLPLDQHPDFDAFKRQSEGKAFNLGGLGSNFNVPSQSPRPKLFKSSSRSSSSREILHSHSHDLAGMGRRSPKRVLSPGSQFLPEESLRASPAIFSRSEQELKNKDNTLQAQPRFALPLDDSRGPAGLNKPRAQTAPQHEPDSALLLTPQHLVNLLDTSSDTVLLLDLRVSTHYAKTHIAGALNLCIPTTLLKRPSFNVHKLAETFKDNGQRRKFELWRESAYIIVYDASSSTIKDAHTCVNTIKKFQSEGYTGTPYIVKGGLDDFARRFPIYLEDGADTDSAGNVCLSIETDGPEVAPVVGGCPMPSTENPANPFFGNIRQNMDLIGGVGQIAIKHPSGATPMDEKDFPEWLRKVSDNRDQGMAASQKFEQIERREKKRMEDALSGHVSYGTPRAAPMKTPSLGGNLTQISGIEKGNKNRYNNIWPFEHSRVKLQGVPKHGDDYFNGSYIKAAWSNKRYISTQAPIPATFSDFWNVVWQQDVRVIVMLTAEKEGPQVKAHNYWDQRQYGPFQVEFLSEKRASIDPARIHRHKNRPSAPKRTSTGPQLLPMTSLDKDEKGSEHPYVTVRRFTLVHERQPFEALREITQLQYSNWPDFGAPAHPAHLLGLVEQCDAVVRSTNKSHSAEPEQANKRPILVHCSAGCGRTGTFCTVDSVIDMLKRQRLSQKEREYTPMDVDPPMNQAAGSDSDNSDATTPTRSKEGVEGSWVQREDQDLVEKTVEEFRRQRLSMVQSLRQYVLCYESVMEWLVEQAHERNDSL